MSKANRWVVIDSEGHRMTSEYDYMTDAIDDAIRCWGELYHERLSRWMMARKAGWRCVRAASLA